MSAFLHCCLAVAAFRQFIHCVMPFSDNPLLLHSQCLSALFLLPPVFVPGIKVLLSWKTGTLFKLLFDDKKMATYPGPNCRNIKHQSGNKTENTSGPLCFAFIALHTSQELILKAHKNSYETRPTWPWLSTKIHCIHRQTQTHTRAHSEIYVNLVNIVEWIFTNRIKYSCNEI